VDTADAQVAVASRLADALGDDGAYLGRVNPPGPSLSVCVRFHVHTVPVSPSIVYQPFGLSCGEQ
jgi:hypothetical protein